MNRTLAGYLVAVAMTVLMVLSSSISILAIPSSAASQDVTWAMILDRFNMRHGFHYPDEVLDVAKMFRNPDSMIGKQVLIYAVPHHIEQGTALGTVYYLDVTVPFSRPPQTGQIAFTTASAFKGAAPLVNGYPNFSPCAVTIKGSVMTRDDNSGIVRSIPHVQEIECLKRPGVEDSITQELIALKTQESYVETKKTPSLAEMIWHALSTRLHYPAQASAKKLQGTAIVSVTMTPNGELEEMRLTQSSGHPILDEDAMATVRSIFPLTLPSSLRGGPLNATVPVRYHLPTY